MFKNKEIINKIEFVTTIISFILIGIATFVGVLTSLPSILMPIGLEVPNVIGTIIAVLTGLAGTLVGIRSMLKEFIKDTNNDGVPDFAEQHLEEFDK